MRTTPGATARFCRIPTGSGTFNAIRYRGYYYDVETGLYYLMSRYYDPATGRFLSPDDLSYLDPETINGLNLFAYCGNNPVMNTDPEGHAWWDALLKVVAAVAIVAAAAVVAVATAGTAVGVIAAGAAIGGAVGGIAGGATGAIEAAKKGEDIFEGFANGMLSGTVTGAISGAVAASPIGVGGQIAVNAAISGGEYLINSAINNNFNSVDFGISVFFGGLGGFLGGNGLLTGINGLKTAGNRVLKMLRIRELSKLSGQIFIEYLLPNLIGTSANAAGTFFKNIY